MADTGAPWNLPYPLPTDLVRDGADAIKDLAEATADGLDAAGGLVAVYHSTRGSDFSTTSSSYVDVTGLAVTMTPADAANNIVLALLVNNFRTNNTNQSVNVQINDGVSDLLEPVGGIVTNSNPAGFELSGAGGIVVPAATTNSRTYQVRLRVSGGATGTLGGATLLVFEVKV